MSEPEHYDDGCPQEEAKEFNLSDLYTALGLMSGTSMDGIDVALVQTDGMREVRRGAALTIPYTAETRAEIATALAHARTIRARQERPGLLPVIERELTEQHAAAVSAFLRKNRIKRSEIDVIGFHGQTVLHRPEDRLTVQIGDGRVLAELTQIPVVSDMRAADVAAGGQGAPLAPIYHWAVTSGIADRPLAVLNIGGVANVTWIGPDGADGAPNLVAFDTGPGSALIDDWMLQRTGHGIDLDGAEAAKGTPDEKVVRFYLDHAYFKQPPPKSLDRNAFYWDMMSWMDTADGAATLTAFTAEAVARAVPLLPSPPRTWIVTGGGRRNRTMMAYLRERLGSDAIVLDAAQAGLDGDAVEAEAWAYLAVRALAGLPLTFPGTTGVPTPLAGGVSWPAVRLGDGALRPAATGG